MAKDPTLIPGIYNYCDRWCERCPFTDRCLNYKTGEEERKEAESRKKDNDRPASELWQDVKETLDETIELLKELMREHGLDPDKMEPDEEYLISEEEIRKKTRVHPLSRMSMSYITMVDKWLDSHKMLFLEKGMYEEKPPAGADEETLRMYEALQVVRWYHFQINVKLQRALNGKEHGALFQEEAMQSDADGSAKVALIGIDNSLRAWHTLMELFPGESEEIANFMIQLGILRQKTETEFPNARSFKRPGFDDPEYAKGLED